MDAVDGERRTESSANSYPYSKKHTNASQSTTEAKKVLKELLSEVDSWLYELEVHQISYNIDVASVEYTGEQLMEVNYTPDYHGVYSPEISRSLQDLLNENHIDAKRKTLEGELVAMCKRDYMTPQNETYRGVVRYVLEELEKSGISNMEELIERNKNHRARQNTDFQSTIDLETYKSKIDEGSGERMFPLSDEKSDIFDFNTS